jgi:plastocyanin
MIQLQEMMKKWVLIIVIVCIAGCQTPEERAKAMQKTIVVKTHTIIIQQMQFMPAELVVNAGDTVTWINKDILDHNVTEETGQEWSSGTLSAGKSWTKVVTNSAHYLCTLHPVMKGSLVVR